MESSDFSVAVLESRKWKNKFSKPGSSVPKDFRHRMLYGRSNRRQSSETQVVMKPEKKRINIYIFVFLFFSVKDIEQARVKQALSGKMRWVVS